MSTSILPYGNRDSSDVRSTSRYRLMVLTSLEEVLPLESAWQRLMPRAVDDTPFLSFEWLVAWWRAFGAGARMYVLTVWEGEDLVGVAPLRYAAARRWGARRETLRFWQNEHSSRVHFVVDKDTPGVLPLFVDHLLHQAPGWDLLVLGPLDRSSELTHRTLLCLRERRVRHGIDPGVDSPYLLLPRDVAAFRAGLSRSLRRDLRHHANRLAAAGSSVRIRFSTQAAELSDAMKIARSSRRHRAGTSMGSTPAVAQFYGEIARAAERRGWLHLAFLDIDAEPVSFQLGLRYNDVLYNLKTAYCEGAAPHSPGLILTNRALEAEIENGVVESDFLGASDPFKLRWTKTVRSHCYICVCRSTPTLLIGFLVHYRLKRWLRRFLRSARDRGRATRDPASHDPRCRGAHRSEAVA